MARLCFAVASCVLLLFLLVVAASSETSSPRPAVYGVGDDTGWAPAPPDNDGAQKLDKWPATLHRFNVGDILDFNHSSDSVLLVRQGDYDRCSAASPVRRFAAGGGGDTRFTIARPGLFYFISAAPARCEAGQRMVVRAVDARPRLASGPGSSTPAPALGMTQSAATPRHTLSLGQKQAVAAAAAFVAGFAFTLLIVWLCVCCRA
ncbi:hypothetical protein U9M48_014708 [Paspalum notatum var. saurae]|uniref:Phytocyanin domain-containing protein n=1 Tax=Paspalum notatum var. saurae TaxID=547442 RepID=A0AAQ3T4Z1_PASNO